MEQVDTTKQKFDFLPLTLSIKTLGDVSTSLVRRGTPLPTERSQIFSTAIDNQKSVSIEVYFGERALARDNLRIGSYLLKDLPPAPKGSLKIRVSFEVDEFCNVEAEAVETQSGNKIEARLKETSLTITQELINRLIREADENREEDHARSVLASAELRVRRAQEENSITGNIKKIETQISDLGIALMGNNKMRIRQLTNNLQQLLTAGQLASDSVGMGDIFNTLFGRGTTGIAPQPSRRTASTTSQATASGKVDSMPMAQTRNVTLIQSFLESIGPQLELKRAGAWEAIESNRADRCSQASHSMREVLRQMLDKLAPKDRILKTPWYKRPESGAPVTRNMRVRYALSGVSEVPSRSTLSLISGLAAVVDSMYDKLSAESHSNKVQTVTETRMYLSACETVILLIAGYRQG